MSLPQRPRIFVENSTLLERLQKLHASVELLDQPADDLTDVDIILSDRRLPETLAQRMSSAERIVGLLHMGEPIVRPDVLPDAMVSTDISLGDLETVLVLLADLVRERRKQSVAIATEQKLLDMAFTDALTGLPNRRAWEQQLEQIEKSSTEICLALIDVDFFKRVNSSDGHAVGDDVLREVGLATRQRLRENDFLARIGGDEFGLVITQVNSTIARKIVDRIRTHVARHLAEKDLPPVTLSAGYTFVAADTKRISSDLYKTATMCLKKAKESSRDCTVGQIVGSAVG